MEYARADRRWAEADPTVVSLELLTVLLGGPLAVYVCWLVRKGDEGGIWFWGAVLATGEIYGGELVGVSFLMRGLGGVGLGVCFG